MDFKNLKSVLITGGTGSFGKQFTTRLIEENAGIERLVVFSRDELKQSEMQRQFPADKYPFLRFFLGDIRDADRLKFAMQDIKTVVHAAALKQVPAAEYNPFEFIKTNVIGSQNVIDAAMACGVENMVALSTDKAASPVNLYGATKLCSDKLFVAANNVTGRRKLNIAVVRYGNVMASRGSVIPLYLSLKDTGVLPITDPRMTRFTISIDQAIDMVLWVLNNMSGSEIFVPKIPSYRITDLAEAIAPECQTEIVGIRPGEKLHEEMITTSDGLNCFDIGDYYAILPHYAKQLSRAYLNNGGKQVPDNFRYDSGSNDNFLTVQEIRALLKTHLGVEVGGR